MHNAGDSAPSPGRRPEPDPFVGPDKQTKDDSEVRQKTCALLSFRLGGTDGVSAVARHWQAMLQELGWRVHTVAGSGPVDHTLPGLALRSGDPPTMEEVTDALRLADLVVVENLLTIPMQLPASRVVAAALQGRPALLHHHDPPWQRDHYRHITELPPTDPQWIHVTINRLTQRQFQDRGITAEMVYNPFDTGEPLGDRVETRRQLGVAEDALLVAHPVRAIARKDIRAALELTATLGGIYWLSGDAEDGCQTELDRLLAAAPCPVLQHPSPVMRDLYAASDVVAFPSTWEGFGNPPIEASIHRKPVAVGPYPVGVELAGLGFHWFSSANPGPLIEFLAKPDASLLDHNQRIAKENLALEVIGDQLKELLDRAGW